MSETARPVFINKRKRSVYFPNNRIDEIRGHAQRLERSFSWVLDYVWRNGRDKLEKMPAVGTWDSEDLVDGQQQESA